MINSEFRFPLFDKIMIGSMNPFSSTNSYIAFLHADEKYITVENIPDKGVYSLTFPAPKNPKCKFYYKRLVNETIDYCNELCEEISNYSDPDIIAYRRLVILHQHLKTCMIKTGEVLQEHQLYVSDFLTPPPGADIEKLSNSYIFHLLKVCIAKAYLEAQRVLGVILGEYMDEAGLYTGYAGEIPPVKCFLIPPKTKLKTETISAKKDDEITEKVINAVSYKSDEEVYKIKDLKEKLHLNIRTIRHWFENGKINGYKIGKVWYVTESNLKLFLQNNKLTLTDNEKSTKGTNT